VPGYIKRITDGWYEACGKVVTPISPLVPDSEESVKLGEKAFLTATAGCFKCHGLDGRGEVIPNADREPGAPPVRSADCRRGTCRSSNRPNDIYRRIYSGINGTPMPSFAVQLKDDPATFWHLVHYVEYVSGARRRALEKEEAEYLGKSHVSANEAADATPP
jgi:mono/diheme cytochrome c family protein